MPAVLSCRHRMAHITSFMFHELSRMVPYNLDMESGRKSFLWLQFYYYGKRGETQLDGWRIACAIGADQTPTQVAVRSFGFSEIHNHTVWFLSRL